MSLLRTDAQVAIDDLLVAIEDSAEKYYDAAEFLDVAAVAAVMQWIGDQRQELAARFDRALRSLGERPSVPDPERQSLEKLAQHLNAAMAHARVAPVLEQRLAAEQHLARLAADARGAGLDDDCRELVDALAEHVAVVTERLQALLRKQGEKQPQAD